MVFLYRRNWRIRRILGIVLGLLVASSVFMAVLRTMQRPAAFPRVSYMQGLSINLTSVVVSPSELHTLPSQVLLDMRNKSRLYKTIFERVHLSPQVKHYPKSIEYREARWLLDTLEDTLYPISRKKYPGGVKQLYDSFSGRGIVMTSGSKHFKYSYHAIQVLRYLNCTLPIELFYYGDSDLPFKLRNKLAELPGVVLIDMTPYVPKHAPGVSGWSLKPLAMLFSKFQELLFLDSDVLFFHDPEKLFYWRAYKSTGTLYFRDRTLPGQYLYKFTDLLIDEFSILGKQNRVYNKMGVEEGESGVIVMDKHRGGTFALLFASLLNVDPYRRFRETYYGVLGDKEAFWIANEVLKLPYSWGPGGGGAIGHHFLQDTSSVCGGLYHTDEDWEPSWFNGGLVRYKWDPVPETFEFKYIALDRSFTQLRWSHIVGTYINCVGLFKPETDLFEIPSKEKKIIDKMFEFWNAIPDPEKL